MWALNYLPHRPFVVALEAVSELLEFMTVNL